MGVRERRPIAGGLFHDGGPGSSREDQHGIRGSARRGTGIACNAHLARATGAAPPHPLAIPPERGSSDVYPRDQRRLSRLGGLPGPRRDRGRGRRGRAVHARQAREAAGPVLHLGVAVPRHRLLPGGGGDCAGRRRSRRLLLRSLPAPGPSSGQTDDRVAAGARRAAGVRRVGVAVGPVVPLVDRQCAAATGRRAPHHLALGSAA